MFNKGDRVITTARMYCCSIHKYIPAGTVCMVYDPNPYVGMGIILKIRTFDKMPNTYATFTINRDFVIKI